MFATIRGTLQFHSMNTTVRVAGGWVRDKLLGLESDDLDLAVDDMLGMEFAERVNEYLAAEGEEIHSLGHIKANPEQSKHLDTCRLKLHGLWIDVVNLRSESYAQDSRIPEMRIGTPEEDALRRDLTLNALFYNINTAEVEDLTGNGLHDLEHGIARTPMDPVQTFRDDPLRVLRAIRFAARFDLTFDTALVEAAKRSEVLEALACKISRERIGAELNGILLGPDPARGLRELRDFGLLSYIFRPADFANCSLHQEEVESQLERGIEVSQHALAMVHSGDLSSLLAGPSPKEACRLLCLSALFSGFSNAKYEFRKGRTEPLSRHLVQEAIKQKVADAEAVASIVDSITILEGILEEFLLGEMHSVPRLRLGLAIRQCGRYWQLSLATLCARDQYTARLDWSREQPFVLENYLLLNEYIHKQGLHDCWDWRPRLNGKEVQDVLGIRPGPHMKLFMDAILEQQIEKPEVTVEELKQFLQGLDIPVQAPGRKPREEGSSSLS